MARAIIRDDKIVKLTSDRNLGEDIGKLPGGIGFERLRWDGEKIVDLFYLDKFYVDKTTRHIYARPHDGCDLVEMSYSDRKKLTVDSETGNLRIKTQAELDKPKKDEYKARRRVEYPSIGDQMGAIMKYLKTKTDLTDELKDLINIIDETKNKWEKTV